MKQLFLQQRNFTLWMIAILLAGIGLYMWVSQDKDTNEDVDTANQISQANQSIAEEIKGAVEQLERDHDGQDALLQCIVNLFIERENITRVDVDRCVIETQVPPPTETDRGTAPSGQADSASPSADTQDNQQSAVSSSNDTISDSPEQSNSSPSAEPNLIQQVIDLITNILSHVPLVGRFFRD